MSATHRAAGQCQRGFGLLEAIVALALFAATGMAIFSWINTDIAIAGRLQDSEQSTRLALLGLEWANTLNPAERPSGGAEIAPGIEVSWQSRLATPRTGGAPFPGGTRSAFDLALFDVELHLSERESGREAQLSLRRVGTWRTAGVAALEAP